MKSKNNLSSNSFHIYLKRTLLYTHLQTFIDQQPKEQFSCYFSENFITAIVIKAYSFVQVHNSAHYTCTFFVSNKNIVLLLLFKQMKLKIPILTQVEPMSAIVVMLLGFTVSTNKLQSNFLQSVTLTLICLH